MENFSTLVVSDIELNRFCPTSLAFDVSIYFLHFSNRKDYRRQFMTFHVRSKIVFMLRV